jgi:thiol-disulfide isomerase/thioredoxin
MAEQRTDVWIWILVAAATVSVVGLAVVQGNKSETRFDGQVAPAVALPLLGGGKSAIQHGKITMVDFWATWCAPCRASMPRVQSVWREYKPKGVDLFSVDTDDPSADREAQVSEFLMQNRLTFPVVLDDGSAEKAFSIVSLPTMVLLDKDGKIVWSHVGALNAGRERDLRAALDRAIEPTH